MYGYVVANKPELKIKEFEVYKEKYCGLCDALIDNHGRFAQMLIQNDMTFLILLLEALYEPKLKRGSSRCIPHPVNKHSFTRSYITDYVADMNVLLAWYKLNDDYIDDKKIVSKGIRNAISGRVKRIVERYPEKAKRIKKSFYLLNKLEKEGCEDIDKVSGAFGSILSEIFVLKNDEWKEHLHRIGYSIGQFVYIMDAYDDMKEDAIKSEYNCLLLNKQFFDSDERFDTFVEEILNAIMATAAQWFEMLPIIKNVELLRNIIYAGVWVRWEELHSVKP